MCIADKSAGQTDGGLEPQQLPYLPRVVNNLMLQASIEARDRRDVPQPLGAAPIGSPTAALRDGVPAPHLGIDLPKGREAWLASFDLPRVPTGLVMRCAVLLARSAERHVPPLLTSASFLLSAGQRAAAIDVLYRTLGLMDEAYLLERPDVAQAVSAGQFGSGLEHYVRHGRAEGMAWPHEVQVTAVLTALLAAGRQGPPLAVRPEQQLRLTLACRAFVDRGQASGIALAPGRGQEADQRQGRLPR